MKSLAVVVVVLSLAATGIGCGAEDGTGSASQAGGEDCTPGYDPCLPPADDYDCAGGEGDGPEYTGRVSVDHGHGDPYDLDADGDGVGCES